jgi:hypothetical protein
LMSAPPPASSASAMSPLPSLHCVRQQPLAVLRSATMGTLTAFTGHVSPYLKQLHTTAGLRPRPRRRWASGASAVRPVCRSSVCGAPAVGERGVRMQGRYVSPPQLLLVGNTRPSPCSASLGCRYRPQRRQGKTRTRFLRTLELRPRPASTRSPALTRHIKCMYASMHTASQHGLYSQPACMPQHRRLPAASGCLTTPPLALSRPACASQAAGAAAAAPPTPRGCAPPGATRTAPRA